MTLGVGSGTGQDFAVYDAINAYMPNDFGSMIHRLAPNGTAPIFGLLSMMGKGTAESVIHGYFTKTMVFPSVQINNGGTAYTNATTTLTIDSNSTVRVRDVLRSHTTGELLRITAINSDTEIVVSRAFGQVAAAAGSVANDEILYCIGNAHEQGSPAPESRVMNPTPMTNYTQIIRSSWALPATMEAIMPQVGENLVAEDRTDCAFFHSQAIEQALIFSQAVRTTVGGKQITAMDGIVETTRRLAPTANTTTAGATTTYAQLQTYLNPVFNTTVNGQNGNERLLIVGGAGRTVVNDIGRLSGQYQIVQGATEFGLKFGSFLTSRGRFNMIEHPLLNAHAAWSKMGLALELSSMKLLPLKGRDTFSREFGLDGKYTENGTDAVGGVLTTELTLEIINPSANAVIFNLTAGA